MSDLIDRQAAIDALNCCQTFLYDSRDKYPKIELEDAKAEIESLPAAEPSGELIRCKDCKHRGEKPIADGRYWCELHGTFMYYCSDAERIEKSDGA